MPDTDQTPKKFLARQEVMDITSKSYTTLWRDMRDGTFPQTYKIGARRVAWLDSEVQDWVNSKIKAA